MRRFSALTWSVVPVKNGESEEGAVAVGSEGGLGQGRQVVHVVETRAVCVIIARQQQVHMIRSPAPKVFCKVLPCEVCCCGWTELITVSHLVELNILLDVLCKLYCVSSFPDTQQQNLLTEFEHLVIVMFHLNDAAGCYIIRGDQDEIGSLNPN